MKRLILTGVLCGAALAQSGNRLMWGTGITAMELRHSCRNKNDLCVGVVAGSVGGLTTRDAALGNGITIEQEIRVVMKFLNDHPELLNRDSGWVVRKALKEAFPAH
jgi:hypothetical protein